MMSKRGFTLIEIIITIVILAIAATMMMTLFGEQFVTSVRPAGLVQNQYGLIQKMENITSYYRNEVANKTIATNWDAFKAFCKDTQKCTYSETKTIGGYSTETEHLQVTCTSGDQNIFAIFTK